MSKQGIITYFIGEDAYLSSFDAAARKEKYAVCCSYLYVSFKVMMLKFMCANYSSLNKNTMEREVGPAGSAHNNPNNVSLSKCTPSRPLCSH